MQLVCVRRKKNEGEETEHDKKQKQKSEEETTAAKTSLTRTTEKTPPHLIRQTATEPPPPAQLSISNAASTIAARVLHVTIKTAQLKQEAFWSSKIGLTCRSLTLFHFLFLRHFLRVTHVAYCRMAVIIILDKPEDNCGTLPPQSHSLAGGSFHHAITGGGG